MCVAGSAVYALEWSTIGGPPLLSSNIDKARFSLDVGVLHVFTQGLPLAMLIAAWARVGRAASFTAAERRALEAIIGFVLITLVLGGGRSFVLLPLIGALVVVGRHVSAPAARRMLIVTPSRSSSSRAPSLPRAPRPAARDRRGRHGALTATPAPRVPR